MALNLPAPIDHFISLLRQLEGNPYQSYKSLTQRCFKQADHWFCFRHIQGSPGAFPASVCLLGIARRDLGLPDHCLLNASRSLAAADYLLRALGRGIHRHARQNRGALGSGSFQPLKLPPQVLHRNVVELTPTEVRIKFRISLPGSSDNRVLGKAAIAMFTEELPAIVAVLNSAATHSTELKKHCDSVEDFFYLQERLEDHGIVAFIGDGALLPRQSGVTERPLEEDAVAFKAPDRLALSVNLPNAGKVRGLGIRPGVTVLIGSAFHGKSTVLDALAKSVYPHIPKDGRERVVTHKRALYVCAEEGRSIKGVDISPFIPELPGKADPKSLDTDNASSSTSQAAAVVEAIASNVKLLLLDEDTSATNFLIRDHCMRKLIPEDHSTPFYDRVREFHHRFGISTLIVVGGSSEYLGVAHHVIAMRRYLPVCMAEAVRRLSLPKPFSVHAAFAAADHRRIQTLCFDPSYKAERLGKTVTVRIKPLRLKEKILEYGDEQLDLNAQKALVDAHQVYAIGYALLLARKKFADKYLSPAQLADTICREIETKGLAFLSAKEDDSLFFAAPRPLELAGAINRYRQLLYG